MQAGKFVLRILVFVDGGRVDETPSNARDYGATGNYRKKGMGRSKLNVVLQ